MSQVPMHRVNQPQIRGPRMVGMQGHVAGSMGEMDSSNPQSQYYHATPPYSQQSYQQYQTPPQQNRQTYPPYQNQQNYSAQYQSAPPPPQTSQNYSANQYQSSNHYHNYYQSSNSNTSTSSNSGSQYLNNHQNKSQPPPAKSPSPPQSHSPAPLSQNQQQQSGNNNVANNVVSTTNGEDTHQTSTLMNSKEKTPMCLINELARYNKIVHQYKLTDESGPAHKRMFTVTLKLGDEEYTAAGPSIKKAQHSTASIALEKTSYKHPPPKSPSASRTTDLGNITPTVELNALAMKRGEMAIYTFLDAPRQYFPPNFNFRGMYNQRGLHQNFDHIQNGRRINNESISQLLHVPRYPYIGMKQGAYPCRVSLRVGSREFTADGPSPQAARHNAASQALRVIKELPMPDGRGGSSDYGDGGNGDDSDSNSDLKSPISLVHEIALKRNLNVTFDVTRESGPPHMRTFITRCSVGEFVTEGDGNGKKVSKKRAAEKMLDELKGLPVLPPSPIAKLKRKPTATKKKSRNLIKEQTTNSTEFPQGINPISRLIQIQQAKKEREPVYSLLAERGMPRRREFVMQVTVGNHTATGTGTNKKLAKRSAAEALLQLMGYSQTNSNQPNKPALKTELDSDKNRKVTFMEESGLKEKDGGSGGSSGRQLVPGLLLMSDAGPNANYNNTPPITQGPTQVSASTLVNLQTTAAIAKELLKGGTSPTADALLKAGQIQQKIPPVTTVAAPAPVTNPLHPKDQLMYLSKLLKFEVQFTDFPKGNRSEFLSLVSLSTDPPHVCHGAGSTIDASHDSAALTALRSLAEYGLDSVSPKDSTKDPLLLTNGQNK